MKEKKILLVGYQGEKGAYSSNAIDAMFKDEPLKKVPFRTSYDVIDALKKNKLDYGLLPLENSIIGNITHNYDLVLENKLTIEREVIIPIHHALIAHKMAIAHGHHPGIEANFHPASQKDFRNLIVKDA